MFGSALKNPLDVFFEAHAQHFVSFVEHQAFK